MNNLSGQSVISEGNLFHSEHVSKCACFTFSRTQDQSQPLKIRNHTFSEDVTFKAGVEQLLPGVAKQRVGEDEVQRAQQQVVGVDQVVADHGEVPWEGTGGEARVHLLHLV